MHLSAIGYLKNNWILSVIGTEFVRLDTRKRKCKIYGYVGGDFIL